MATKFTYSISNDTKNGDVVQSSLYNEIINSNITIALESVNSEGDVLEINFNTDLSAGEETTLDGIIADHEAVYSDVTPPVMDDGRPIVRADTRPIDYETYFTMAGDSTGIGTGEALRWDWSNSDNDYDGPGVPSGYKCKKIDLTFICPIHSKDGSIYFFDVPWGCYVQLDVVVPAGNYYPNDAGSIPASALGLSGSQMYAYATTEVDYQRFVNKHYIYGDCPMGDELNAEGCSVNAIPIGWILRGSVYTPTSDNVSKGYASFEMYRCHTMILPGQTIESLH